MSTSEVKNDGWSTPASIKETFGKDGIKIRNTPGSTAGAGSGEFHQYRYLRRKEYYRLKKMENDEKEEQELKEYNEKKQILKSIEENKTSKKAAKRKKKKQKEQEKRKQNKGDESKKEGQDSDSNSVESPVQVDQKDSDKEEV